MEKEAHASSKEEAKKDEAARQVNARQAAPAQRSTAAGRQHSHSSPSLRPPLCQSALSMMAGCEAVLGVVCWLVGCCAVLRWCGVLRSARHVCLSVLLFYL